MRGNLRRFSQNDRRYEEPDRFEYRFFQRSKYHCHHTKNNARPVIEAEFWEYWSPARELVLFPESYVSIYATHFAPFRQLVANETSICIGL